jgi:hypothetical protein
MSGTERQDAPLPNANDPRDAAARQLVADAALVRPWTAGQRAQTWERIEARVRGEARGSRSAFVALAVAGSALALALVLMRPMPRAGTPEPAQGSLQAPAQGGLQAQAQASSSPEAPALPGAPARPAVASLAAPSGWARTELPHRGALAQAAGSALRVRPELGLVELELGEIEAIASADPASPMVIATPGLRVVATSASFRISVASRLTRLQVDRGQARVETGSGDAVVVDAGGSYDLTQMAPPAPLSATPARATPVRPSPSPSPHAARRLQSAALAAAEPPPTPAPSADTEDDKPTPKADCGDLAALPAREQCYQGLAARNDLAGENALYALAMLAHDVRRDGARTLQHLRAHQSRFPHGVLAPEVSSAALTELLAEQRFEEAERETEHYLALAPQGARAAEVLLIQGNLFREHLATPARARQAYQAALALALPDPLRGEALFFEGLAARDAGDLTGARRTWQILLAQLPTSPHAAEAQRLLDATAH